MPVSSRHIIAGVALVTLVLTSLNIRLIRHSKDLRTTNKALILQNDSIRSVELNIEKNILATGRVIEKESSGYSVTGVGKHRPRNGSGIFGN